GMANDQEKFEKLWIRYIEERATPQEIDELFTALQDESQGAEHAHWAQQASMRIDSDLPADPAQEQTVWQQLLQQADGLAVSLAKPPGDRRGRVRRLAPWAWAASIAVVLGIAMYFVDRKSEPSASQVIASTNIVPGKDGAILTLADGTQI